MSDATEILGTLASDVMRVVFLFVGQGEATLFLIPNGQGGHISLLVDCNRGVGLNGIDIPRLLKDLLPQEKRGNKNVGVLDVFANTHPHKDHIGGLAELKAELSIKSVWHSGHKPGPDHDGPYQELQSLITSVKEAGGTVRELLGSGSSFQVGQADVHVVSPAKHVCEDIQDEKPEDRYKRIHEQCAVFRVGYGSVEKKARVLITGDSDKTAWKKHIRYHYGEDKDEGKGKSAGKGEENRVSAEFLSASHHGSYTFFKDKDEDPEPYDEHLKFIAPTHIIISAPDKDDSPHGHPDPYALKKYKAQVGEEGIHHMGSEGNSFILDVHADGTYELRSDHGDLAEKYGLGKDEQDDGGSGGKSVSKSTLVISRVERSRPMGKS
jgi:beta-lactamase superfamily II metal-dependent hydrolase